MEQHDDEQAAAGAVVHPGVEDRHDYATDREREEQGERPDRASEEEQREVVAPQTEPTMRLAARALRRPWSRGRAKPRHPSSSPTALPGKIENRSNDSV